MSDRRRSLFHQPSKSEDGRYIWLAPVSCTQSLGDCTVYCLDLEDVSSGFFEKTYGSSVSANHTGSNFINGSSVLPNGHLLTLVVDSDASLYIYECSYTGIVYDNSYNSTRIAGSYKKGRYGGYTNIRIPQVICDRSGSVKGLVSVHSSGSEPYYKYTRHSDFLNCSQETSESYLKFSDDASKLIGTVNPFSSVMLGSSSSFVMDTPISSNNTTVANTRIFKSDLEGNLSITVPYTHYKAVYTDTDGKRMEHQAFMFHCEDPNTSEIWQSTTAMLPDTSGSIGSDIASESLIDAGISQNGQYSMFGTVRADGGYTTFRRFLSCLWKSENFGKTYTKVSWEIPFGEVFSGIAVSADGRVVYLATATYATSRIENINVLPYSLGNIYRSQDGGNTFNKILSFDYVRSVGITGSMSAYGILQMYELAHRIQVTCSGDGQKACIFFVGKRDVSGGSGREREPRVKVTVDAGKTWKDVSVNIPDLMFNEDNLTSNSPWGKPRQYQLLQNRSYIRNI